MRVSFTMNQTYQPKASGQKRVFKYRHLEFFTKTHSFIPVSIFIISSIGLIFWGVVEEAIEAKSMVLSFLVGLLVFTWIEYIVHRYVFHMKISTKMRKRIQYLFHGVHHEFPKDKDRLAMPPLASITLAVLVFLIFELLFGDWAWGFGAGFFTGYAGYLFVHYIVHAWRMPKNSLKVLWINHNIHHYQDENVAFGVSSPLWDIIYRTMPKKLIGKTHK
jgi:4-hydroxysphinganine ceramide fatty acyl 2-hydroxylase